MWGPESSCCIFCKNTFQGRTLLIIVIFPITASFFPFSELMTANTSRILNTVVNDKNITAMTEINGNPCCIFNLLSSFECSNAFNRCHFLSQVTWLPLLKESSPLTELLFPINFQTQHFNLQILNTTCSPPFWYRALYTNISSHLQFLSTGCHADEHCI